MRRTILLALLVLGGPSCTEPNPNYLAPDAGRRDQRLADGAAADRGAGPDQRVEQPAVLDLWSAADSEPWDCTSDADCADGLACTEDRCSAGGTCQNRILPGSCLIDGACYSAGDHPEDAPCISCDPSGDARAWTTAADGTPCPDDGLWCTSDICSAGSCLHLATEGCLIAGQCRAEGWSASGYPCSECLPLHDAGALTFIAGKACPTPSGGQGMCYQQACWPFEQEVFEPKLTGSGNTSLLKTSLYAVAPIAPGGEVWAAGGFSLDSSTKGGLLVPLESASVTLPVLTGNLMRGLHHRLAVGDSGEAWYHDGKKWVAETSLMLQLMGMTRSAIWGSRVGGEEVYYLGDYQTVSLPGVVRCSGNPGSFNCKDHPAFATGTLIGGVMGSSSGNTQGPVWAASYGSSEDIYYHPGSGTSWSKSAPQGCEDLGLSGPTACSNTGGDFTDLYGSGPQDIWVVGTGGIILHYDGSAWQRVSGVVGNQSQTHFSAVFSSPTDGLVSFAYHRMAYWGRTVGLLTYNSALDRWLTPIELYSSGVDQAEIRDIGGSGYDQLYLVGQRAVAPPVDNQQAGWVVHLARP